MLKLVLTNDLSHSDKTFQSLGKMTSLKFFPVITSTGASVCHSMSQILKCCSIADKTMIDT